MDIKILVATHKKYRMPSDKCYLPIHVGKEGKNDIGYIGDNIGNNELINIVEKIIWQTKYSCPSFRANDFINFKYKKTCDIIKKYGLLIFDNSDIFNSKIDEYIEVRLKMLNNVFDESMWNKIKMKYDEELDFYNDELRELFEKATTRIFQS